jgi:hypothetical protein
MHSNKAIAAARRKLVGTWRSDRARSMENWVFPKRIAAKKLRFFESIFGNSTWRFTLTSCSSTFKKLKFKERYKIIWANEDSAVVVFTAKGKEICHHLFFEGKHFYMSIGRAGNAEYFKKLRA